MALLQEVLSGKKFVRCIFIVQYIICNTVGLLGAHIYRSASRVSKYTSAMDLPTVL